MEIQFTLLALLVVSLLHGTTMKIADLMDEHGLRWFKGDKYVFGVLWGVFGAMMILGGSVIATFYIALTIHWILRYRIDFLNHGIATSIILITLLFNIQNFSVDWILFGIVFLTYSIHGLFNDQADKGLLRGFWSKYFESNSHYVTVPILLTIYNPIYLPLILISVIHLVSYEATKHIARKRGYS